MNSAVFDNSKIKRAVPEFACDVTWKEGLARAIEWHRSHPQFQTIDADMNQVMDQVVSAYTRAWPNGKLDRSGWMP